MSNPALTELLASYVPKLIQNRVVADPSPIEVACCRGHCRRRFCLRIFRVLHFSREQWRNGDPAGVETLARILNEYFGQLIDIIHEYGGDVVKFAGDAVIAVWPIVSTMRRRDGVHVPSHERINGSGQCALPNARSRSVSGSAITRWRMRAFISNWQ